MAHVFSEIRAFTGEEIAWMQATLKQIDDRIAQAESDYWRMAINPANYIFEPQRDSLAGAKRLLDKDKQNAAQLRDTMAATIESGDTDKLARWFALANTIIGQGAIDVFNNALNYASTGKAITETAKASAKPTSWPWWVWAVGGLAVLSILSPYVSAFNRRK